MKSLLHKANPAVRRIPRSQTIPVMQILLRSLRVQLQMTMILQRKETNQMILKMMMIHLQRSERLKLKSVNKRNMLKVKKKSES